MSLFWTLYAFFFAVPFPMILYYPITYGAGLSRSVYTLSSPYGALAYLLASLVLWSMLLMRYFRRWIMKPLWDGRVLRQLVREGIPREAEVIAAKPGPQGADGSQEWEITIQFENHSGTPIQESLSVVDMRPELGRFAVGRRVSIRLSKQQGRVPMMAFVDADTYADKGRWILSTLGWMLLVGIVAGYYVFSYQFENQGTGWRFLTIYHPLLLCPLLLLGMRWLTEGGFAKHFLGTNEALWIKYEGYRTEATLLAAEQTGTYINEQPQVRFELEYKDRIGNTHRVSFKKVVSLLDMSITRAATIPIFYLADHPQKIAFASDLQP